MKAGPTFSVPDGEIHSPLTFVLYGDQRFMNPATNAQSSPSMRQLLVKQIAKEKPAAIIMNGDIPNDGKSKDDYAVYKSETKAWRDGRAACDCRRSGIMKSSATRSCAWKTGGKRFPQAPQQALVFHPTGFARLRSFARQQ